MSDLISEHFALESFVTRAAPAAGANIHIAIDNAIQFINVRGDDADEDFKATMSSVDCALPASANTFVGAEPSVYWLGPDEWLIATHEDAIALHERIQTGCRGNSGSAVNLSDTYVQLILSGAAAAQTIAKGCTIDLHPAVFRKGNCAQTVLSRAGILLACVENGNIYQVTVRRSFAEYLALWLQNAAPNKKVEFAVTSS